MDRDSRIRASFSEGLRSTLRSGGRVEGRKCCLLRSKQSPNSEKETPHGTFGTINEVKEENGVPVASIRRFGRNEEPCDVVDAGEKRVNSAVPSQEVSSSGRKGEDRRFQTVVLDLVPGI
jgi:hypothetical protein